MFNRSALKIVVAAAVMGGVLYPLRGYSGLVETLALAGLGAAIYGAVLLVLRPSDLLPALQRS
jgi:hypothetical protein